MVEMVCLHVISLMEALQECNSTIFVKVGIPHHEYLIKGVVCLIVISGDTVPCFAATQNKQTKKTHNLRLNF